MGKAKVERAKNWAAKNTACPKCGGSNIVANEDNTEHKCAWCKHTWTR